MTTKRRWISTLLAVSISYAGLVQGAQAALIGTEAVAAAAQESVSQTVAPGVAKARLAQTLDRADVVAALSARGVDVDQARARVAALDDAQASALLAQIDSAPAGADGLLGTIVFIFVLLLITDILGFTKVFPFTRTIR